MVRGSSRYVKDWRLKHRGAEVCLLLLQSNRGAYNIQIAPSERILNLSGRSIRWNATRNGRDHGSRSGKKSPAYQCNCARDGFAALCSTA